MMRPGTSPAVIVCDMRWSAEVRAATVLLGLALVGAAIRGCRPGPGAPGAVWAGAEGGGPAAVRADAERLARPLAPGERLDVNRATAAELARLPRVGPALAARIVEARDRTGGFRSLEELGRVPGIGPATMAGMAPHLTLPSTVRPSARPPVRLPLNRASAAELQSLPGIGPALAAAIVADRDANGPFRTADDLARVRGIGPVLVERLRGRILLP